MTLKERYLGFSKQDLRDRLGALEIEHKELVSQREKVYDEILRIEKLLEE